MLCFPSSAEAAEYQYLNSYRTITMQMGLWPIGYGAAAGVDKASENNFWSWPSDVFQSIKTSILRLDLCLCMCM